MAAARRKAIVGKDCVACGNCVKNCPLNAIAIQNGMRAVVDDDRCVGCGKCAVSCPADVITIVLREAATV